MSVHFLVEELVPPYIDYYALPDKLKINGWYLVRHLEYLRDLVACPVYINTYHLGYKNPRIGAGFRDVELNKKVGGLYKGQVLKNGVKAKRDSLHTMFLAADVYCPAMSLEAIADNASKVGFNEIVIYENKHFVHMALDY